MDTNTPARTRKTASIQQSSHHYNHPTAIITTTSTFNPLTINFPNQPISRPANINHQPTQCISNQPSSSSPWQLRCPNSPLPPFLPLTLLLPAQLGLPPSHSHQSKGMRLSTSKLSEPSTPKTKPQPQLQRLPPRAHQPLLPRSPLRRNLPLNNAMRLAYCRSVGGAPGPASLLRTSPHHVTSLAVWGPRSDIVTQAALRRHL